eukprot:1158435-Pelagomonas_calceolata.AAC.2
MSVLSLYDLHKWTQQGIACNACRICTHAHSKALHAMLYQVQSTERGITRWELSSSYPRQLRLCTQPKAEASIHK